MATIADMPGVAGAVKSMLKSLLQNSRGTTSIEYALICGFIFLAIVTAVGGVGSENGGIWGNLSSKTTTAMGSAS
jgi:Flp pilus assembly pilin Flp